MYSQVGNVTSPQEHPAMAPKLRSSWWLNSKYFMGLSHKNVLSAAFLMTTGRPRQSKQTPVPLGPILHKCKHSHWNFLILTHITVAAFTFMYINWAFGCTLVQDCHVEPLWYTFNTLQLSLPSVFPWINLLTGYFCPLVMSSPLIQQTASYEPLLRLLCLCLLPWLLLISGCTQ